MQGNRCGRYILAYSAFIQAGISVYAICFYIICMQVCVKQRYSRHHGPVFYLVAASFSPRAQDSTLSLRVTHGEAAPCPWRTEGITALSLSVTPALSRHAPALAGWARRGGPSWAVTDWQVTGEASPTACATDTPTFIHNPVWFDMCVWMCACIQTHAAGLFNTTGMGLQGPSVGQNAALWDLLCS